MEEEKKEIIEEKEEIKSTKSESLTEIFNKINNRIDEIVENQKLVDDKIDILTNSYQNFFSKNMQEEEKETNEKKEKEENKITVDEVIKKLSE